MHMKTDPLKDTELHDKINRETSSGERLVRIHAVGFPVQFAAGGNLQTTGIRFAALVVFAIPLRFPRVFWERDIQFVHPKSTHGILLQLSEKS